jgi:hypothetical protein
MRVCKIFAATIFAANCILAIQSTAIAQQRAGVRPNANAPEGCYIVGPLESESVYSFVMAQIQALSLAHRGESANLKMLESQGDIPFDDKTITNLREDRLDNFCASFIISQYIDSKQPAIAAIAKSLASEYDEFGEMSNQMLGVNLKMFLRTTNSLSPRRQFSLLMENRRKVLQRMTGDITLSLSLLIDEDRTDADGKPHHLILKKAGLMDLLYFLHTRFPALKDSQGTVHSGDFFKQAVSIEAFLTGSYRPADAY